MPDHMYGIEEDSRAIARKNRLRQLHMDISAVCEKPEGQRLLSHILKSLHFGELPSEDHVTCQIYAMRLYRQIQEACPTAAENILKYCFSR